METADRNYVEALIEKAQAATRTADLVAQSFQLDDVAEKLSFARGFVGMALEKLTALDRNPDGTTGPEHVTSEGRELDPPKG